jgi:hypothetical protein
VTSATKYFMERGLAFSAQYSAFSP